MRYRAAEYSRPYHWVVMAMLACWYWVGLRDYVLLFCLVLSFCYVSWWLGVGVGGGVGIYLTEDEQDLLVNT